MGFELRDDALAQVVERAIVHHLLQQLGAAWSCHRSTTRPQACTVRLWRAAWLDASRSPAARRSHPRRRCVVVTRTTSRQPLMDVRWRAGWGVAVTFTGLVLLAVTLHDAHQSGRSSCCHLGPLDCVVLMGASADSTMCMQAMRP